MANKNLNSLFGGKINFHPEVKDRFDFVKLEGKKLILLDGKMLCDFKGQFGRQDSALMLFEYVGKDKSGKDVDIKFTTISSHVAIVNQMEKICEKRYFPADITIVRQGDSQYYAFEIPEGSTLPETESGDDSSEDLNMPF